MEGIDNILVKLNNAEEQQTEDERMYLQKQQEMYKDFFQENIPEILRLRKENLAIERSLGNIKGELSYASNHRTAIKSAVSHIIAFPAAIIFMFIYFKFDIYALVRDSFEIWITGVTVGLLSIYPFGFMSIALPILLFRLIFNLLNIQQMRIFKKYNITKKEYKKVLETTHKNDTKIASLLPNWLVDFVKVEFKYYKKYRSSRYGELTVELFELYGNDIHGWKKHIENMGDGFKESTRKIAQKKETVQAADDVAKLAMEYQVYKSIEETDKKSSK
jgi:hypothetical protein